MKLLIWGIGQLSWHTVINLSEKDIIGYIDTYSDKNEFSGKPLYKPEEIKGLEYDAILVSTIFSKEIAEICNKLEISLDKIIFVYGNIQTWDMNQNYEFVTKICGKEFSDFIRNRYRLIRQVEMDFNCEKSFDISNHLNKKICQSDYIRVKTFELLVDEIKSRSVNGQIAELGVFKGDFAQLLNAAFPKRILYLFDTFDGFDEKEIEREAKSELNKETMLVIDNTYKNPSVQEVMDKMVYKNNIIIKQGLFPESLEGLEDNFAFVSLDCDWEESLYQGLVYFYPRLVQGGYIMMHDYNCRLGQRAKKAIQRYESSIHAKIPKVPICDASGSLVLTK